MKLPFKVDLKDKVVVITGAGGIICSHLARAVAECGAKVCLLDLNKDAADVYAKEIVNDGYVRPDHGRQIWGEKAKPGYGLYDRALGAAYFNGLWEAAVKEKK